jgi:Alpha/beta hydrolase family
MRKLKISLTVVFLAVCIAIGAGVIWAMTPYRAESAAYAKTIANSDIIVETQGGFITLYKRNTQSKTGLIFYPGLRVEPQAYVRKLAQIAAAADIKIVIGRPPMNIAAFSISQADEMREVIHGVDHWYVGGHSMGGAMALLYASRNPNRVSGVMLWGTYCGADISALPLRVLSVSGENDGVFPPSKISAARNELPVNATVVQVGGMNHAQFGNYGPQSGDAAAAITDEVAASALVKSSKDFFSGA